MVMKVNEGWAGWERKMRDDKIVDAQRRDIIGYVTKECEKAGYLSVSRW